MQDFHDLKVWGKAHQLTLDVYRITCDFPKNELYGLISQMRKSSASISTNIAEGCGRNGGPEFARFLQIALGSASEIEYQLLLTKDLNFLKIVEYESLNARVVEIKKMLVSLMKKVKSNNPY